MNGMKQLSIGCLLILFAACASQKEHNGTPSAELILDEIIVTVHQGYDINQIVKQIKKPTFKIKQTLSKRMGIYLIHYDIGKYKPSKALVNLKSHEGVKSAEFNKKVQIRN